MTVAAIAYYRDYLGDHLHPESMLRSSSIWNDEILFEEKVVVRYPWDATDDTPKITGLPPDIVLLAKVESMKLEMAALKADLKSTFESTLIEQLDQREVGGSGFARGNEIVEKLETILERVAAPAPAAASAPAVAEDVLGFGEDGGHVSDDDEEEDIVLALDEPEHMPPRKRARIIRDRTQEQLSNRKMKCGYHHGLFNPLPSSWTYPKGMTVIQLMNLWLIGSPRESVPPLGKLKTVVISHFDARGKVKSKMKTVMNEIQHLAELEGVWLECLNICMSPSGAP